MMGGLNTAAAQQTTYYAKLNADGSIGAWNTGSSFATTTGCNSGTVANGYIYMVGNDQSAGCDAQSPSFVFNTVQYAKLNADGSIDGWTATNGLPIAMGSVSTVALNGYLYVIGGHNNTDVSQSTIYYAALNSDGTVGNWNTSSYTFPVANDGQKSVVVNGYIYTFGGYPFNPKVYYASGARVRVSGALDLVGGSGQTLADGGSGGELTAGNTNIVGTLQVMGSANFAQNMSVGGSLTVTGPVAFQNSTNTVNAFQVQNSSNEALFNIDTTNPVSDLTTNTTRNVVTNGSFEDGAGTTGWTNKGASATVAQSSLQQYIGNSSMLVTTPATANRGAEYPLTTSTLASNTTYTLTLSARLVAPTGSISASMSTLEIGHADNGSTDTSCLTAQTITSKGWTTQTCTFTTGTTSVTQYIYIKQTDATARSFYVDGVQLTRMGILTNPSIESAISGNWVSLRSPTTFQRSTAQSEFGSASLQIVTNTTVNSPVGEGAKQAVTLNDNTTYTLSFSAFGTGTALSTMEAGYSSDGTTEGTVCITGQSVNTFAWLQYMCTFTTPSSHSGTPYIYIKNTAATTRTFFIDGVTLTTGNTATAYRNGTISLNGTITSPTVFQNQSDSTSAFQIQNSTGLSLVNVDTANLKVSINATNISIGDSGMIQPWQTGNNTGFTGRDSYGSVVVNGYVYIIGGLNSGGTLQSIVQYAKLLPNGNVGNWVNGVSLPEVREGLTAVTANGYIYVMGGETTGGTIRSSIYYAKVNPDGSLNNWQTATNSMPNTLEYLAGVTLNGYIYAIGGFDGSNVATTYYAKLNVDGSISAWSTASATLAFTARGVSATTANGYIYVAGGNGAADSYGKPNATGNITGWGSVMANLPADRGYGALNAMNGYLYYVAGGSSGFNPSTYNANVYFGPINTTDGSVNSWACQGSANDCTGVTPINGTSLPDKRFAIGDGLQYNGYIYVIGGNNGTTGGQNTVYYTSSRTQVSNSLDLVGNGSADMSGSLVAGNTNIVGGLNVVGPSTLAGGVTVTSSAVFQNTTNSSTAFQIQNASGVNNLTVTTANLISNATFETGPTNLDNSVTGWSKKLGSETSIKTQASNALFGSDSMEIVTTTTAQQGALYSYAFAASTQYTFSFYAKISTGSFSTLTFGRSDTGAAGGETNCVTTGAISTTYTRFSCTFTTGSTIGASGTPYIYMSKGTDTTARTIYIDGVQLEQGGSATTYTEGNIKLDGQLTFKNSADSTTAYQVQNAAGTTILGLDTTTGTIFSNIADGASAVGFTLNGANTYSTTGAKLLSVQNGGSERFAIDKDGNVKLYGHIISGGTTPSASADFDNVGAGGDCIVSGNDTAGIITIDTGPGSVQGHLCDITFANSFAAAPKVIISPGSDTAPGVGLYVNSSAVTSAGFNVGSGYPPTDGVTYVVYYYVIQ
jgi:N-acetylneuraminic acid mutarotase